MLLLIGGRFSIEGVCSDVCEGCVCVCVCMDVCVGRHTRVCTVTKMGDKFPGVLLTFKSLSSNKTPQFCTRLTLLVETTSEDSHGHRIDEALN